MASHRSSGTLAEHPRILLLESVQQFQHSRDQWESLAGQGQPDIHLTGDWILSWWEAFGDDGAVTCVIGIDAQGCFALIPLLFKTRRLGLWPVRYARLLGNDFSSRSDVRVLRHEQLVRDALYRLIWSRGCMWFECGWLPAASCNYLTSGLEGVVVHRCFDLPLVVFGNGWEDWLAAKSRTFRKTLRKASEQCENMTIRRFPDDFSDHMELLDCMDRVVDAAWSHAQGSSYRSSAADFRFMQAISQRFSAAGQLIATVLFDGQQPVSFAFGVQLGPRVFGLKTAYRQANENASMGTHTMMHFAKLSAERGAAVMDMDVITTHGEYKRRWCNTIETVRWDRVFRPGLRGRALLQAYRLPGRIGTLARSLRSTFSRSPDRTET